MPSGKEWKNLEFLKNFISITEKITARNHSIKVFPLSLTKQLGINQIYATPYHGQAKPIERFWETLEDRFCKFFPTYLGKDAKKRPGGYAGNL